VHLLRQVQVVVIDRVNAFVVVLDQVAIAVVGVIILDILSERTLKKIFIIMGRAEVR
jgi:hypothetical protein